MGLDVYLKRFENFSQAQQREFEFERLTRIAWKQIAGKKNYKEVSETEKELYRQAQLQIAASLNLDTDGRDPSVQNVDKSSTKYPDHDFRVGYFYSTYKESGINEVLLTAGVDDLHSIFNPQQRDYFQPDWSLARTVCLKAISDFGAYMEENPYQVMTVDVNRFLNRNEINTKFEALQSFLKFKSSLHPSILSKVSGFENLDGIFFPEQPIEVVGLIPGIDNRQFFNSKQRPCLYVVYEHQCLEWYLHALEIVLETCDYMLGLDEAERQKHYLV